MNNIDAYHSPERMGAMLIINAPTIVYTFYSMISYLLDDRTANKIRIFASEEQWRPELLKLVDPSQLPPEYGGTGTSKLHEAYRDRGGEQSYGRRQSHVKYTEGADGKEEDEATVSALEMAKRTTASAMEKTEKAAASAHEEYEESAAAPTSDGDDRSGAATAADGGGSISISSDSSSSSSSSSSNIGKSDSKSSSKSSSSTPYDLNSADAQAARVELTEFYAKYNADKVRCLVSFIPFFTAVSVS